MRSMMKLGAAVLALATIAGCENLKSPTEPGSVPVDTATAEPSPSKQQTASQPPYIKTDDYLCHVGVTKLDQLEEKIKKFSPDYNQLPKAQHPVLRLSFDTPVKTLDEKTKEKLRLFAMQNTAEMVIESYDTEGAVSRAEQAWQVMAAANRASTFTRAIYKPAQDQGSHLNVYSNSQLLVHAMRELPANYYLISQAASMSQAFGDGSLFIGAANQVYPEGSEVYTFSDAKKEMCTGEYHMAMQKPQGQSPTIRALEQLLDKISRNTRSVITIVVNSNDGLHDLPGKVIAKALRKNATVNYIMLSESASTNSLDEIAKATGGQAYVMQ